MPERNDLIARQEVRWQVTQKNGRKKQIVVSVGERVFDKLPDLTTPELDRLVGSGHIGMPDKLVVHTGS